MTFLRQCLNLLEVTGVEFNLKLCLLLGFQDMFDKWVERTHQKSIAHQVLTKEESPER